LIFNVNQKMFKLLTLLIYLTSVSAVNFADFVSIYGKTYESTQEYLYRKEVFRENLGVIDTHNMKNLSWKLSMNHFGDLRWEEFRSSYLGDRKSKSKAKMLGTTSSKNIRLPDSFDWSKRGAVTKPKNQGKCGSCWAFSSTGALEGLHYISRGKLVSFSEQDLIDCSKSFGNNGCSGGIMDMAFKYVMEYGICAEQSYPYAGKDQSCQLCKEIFKISGFEDVTPNNETALQQAVYKQPVSVAIEANQQAFQFYSGGVFDGECGTNLDHGVLLVGWGENNGVEYWKVKNSWGEDWGDHGYILLERNVATSGLCGIAMQPSVPKL